MATAIVVDAATTMAVAVEAEDALRMELEQRVEAAELRAAIAESAKAVSGDETAMVAAAAAAVVAGRSAAAAVQAIIDQQRVDAASQTESGIVRLRRRSHGRRVFPCLRGDTVDGVCDCDLGSTPGRLPPGPATSSTVTTVT